MTRFAHQNTVAVRKLPLGVVPLSTRERNARHEYTAANLAWWAARRHGASQAVLDALSTARANAWATLVTLESLETL